MALAIRNLCFFVFYSPKRAFVFFYLFVGFSTRRSFLVPRLPTFGIGTISISFLFGEFGTIVSISSP